MSQPSFAKRMRDYAEEGIKHFYFMMLQKDEVTQSFLLMILRPHPDGGCAVPRRDEERRHWPICESQL